MVFIARWSHGFCRGRGLVSAGYTTRKHLQTDHRCGIYETRPQICRDYTTSECEFEDDWCYEKYFETPEQIDEYADIWTSIPRARPRAQHSLRSRRPTGLPIAVME